MKDQLLDGTLIISFVVKEDPEVLYAGTSIYRMDIEGVHLEEFMKHLEKAPGLVHMDHVVAVTDIVGKGLARTFE